MNDVVLTLDTELAGLFNLVLGATSDQVFIMINLGSDEVFFEIGMNHGRRLRGMRTRFYGPGAGLFFASCKIRNQTKEAIGRVGQAIDAGLGETQVI